MAPIDLQTMSLILLDFPGQGSNECEQVAGSKCGHEFARTRKAMAKRGHQSSSQQNEALRACLRTLINLLGDGVANLTEAQTSLEIGQQNAAVGSILEMEARLADAMALHRAILVLHRYR